MRINQMLNASLKNGFFKAAVALLAVCAVAAQAEAQSSSNGQAFPWSSSTSKVTTPNRHAVVNNRPTPAINHGSSFNSGQAPTVTNFERQITVDGQTLVGQVIDGEVVYMDAATSSSWANTSPTQAVQSAAKYQRDAASSTWGKAKDVASSATSVFKKPLELKLPSMNLFKRPEGLTLPSASMSWSKPKFSQPTNWFSRTAESDITFAPLGGLPNSGQYPTSIDATRSSIAAAPVEQFYNPSAYVQEIRSQGDSVWEAATERTASSTAAAVDNSFAPLR